jgi:A/G-specific adenine glycosylase
LNTSQTLIHWYRKNKRDLPWRNTNKPYYIWISEIILQQTRVNQGLSYYNSFIQKFPEIKYLAGASEDEVLKMWQGLGYYSRARNLHRCAKEIMEKHHGKFPESYEEIRALPGIGDYTAAAIASFSFHLPYPVLDGNVYRFLSRYFGIRIPINTGAAKKEFYSILQNLIKDAGPHEFNQAIMEFGAIQCKPTSPDCAICPLQSSCYAFENNSVDQLPVKVNKQKIRNRYFYYLVIRNRDHLYLQKRTKKDIWQNLYEFPLIESKKKFKIDFILLADEWNNFFRSSRPVLHSVSKETKHILSHQVLHTRFIELSLSERGFKQPDNWQKVDIGDVKNYAVPRLIDKYLKEHHEKYFREKQSESR